MHLRTLSAILSMILLGSCDQKPSDPAARKSNDAVSQSAEAQANASASQDGGQLKQRCKDFPKEGNDETARTAPPAIPDHLKGFVAASTTTLTVLSLDGKRLICTDIQWALDLDFQLIRAVEDDEERFLGMDYHGYENYGFSLIDRRGKPEEIETGVEPIFSPSGRRFASAEWSQSTFGGLNNLGVWEVDPNGTRQIYELPEAQHALLNEASGWWPERWAGDQCVVFSMVHQDQPDPAGDSGRTSLEQMPRRYFELKETSGKWVLKRSTAEGACSMPSVKRN